MELDSHADTIVFGSNAIIMQYMSRDCNVSPYADSYEPIRNVPIVTGATAVTSQITGETLILFFNKVVWMGAQLDHSLINPNQLRHHGIVVQDNPYADTSMHLASHNDEFIMPMQAEGTTIFFDSRTQTNYKLANCPHIVGIPVRCSSQPLHIMLRKDIRCMRLEMCTLSIYWTWLMTRCRLQNSSSIDLFPKSV
jgi:hypothetical protein